jgi:hypothetical protein
MDRQRASDPFSVIARWSIPFTMLISVMGGSAWLTTTANKVTALESEVAMFRAEYQLQRDRMFDQLSDQDQRLSRIEGKLDIVIESLRGKR